jgi:chromosome partitioning protein
MSKVICVALRKGGSGKTTTAVNLASALQLKGKKTLLIDLEHTANATISVGIDPFSLPRSINTLFTNIEAQPQEVLVRTEYGLHVLPATEDLEQTEAGMTATHIGLLKPIVEALRSSFDFIIIDTPPGKSYLSLSALVASDYVLIPLQTHYLAMQGLARILDDVRKVKKGLNPSLEVLGILPTMVQPNTNISKTVVKNVREQYADLVLPIEIKYSVKHAEASLIGQPIVIYSPSHEGAQEYFKLAEVVYGKAK